MRDRANVGTWSPLLRVLRPRLRSTAKRLSVDLLSSDSIHEDQQCVVAHPPHGTKTSGYVQVTQCRCHFHPLRIYRISSAPSYARKQIEWTQDARAHHKNWMPTTTLEHLGDIWKVAERELDELGDVVFIQDSGVGRTNSHRGTGCPYAVLDVRPGLGVPLPSSCRRDATARTRRVPSALCRVGTTTTTYPRLLLRNLLKASSLLL